MKLFQIILTLSAVSVLHCICTDRKIKKENTHNVIGHLDSGDVLSRIIPVNEKKLVKFTPGENGMPGPVKVKMNTPFVHEFANQTIIPGLSVLLPSKEQKDMGQKTIMSKKPVVIELDKAKLCACTPGKLGFLLPKIYQVEEKSTKNHLAKNYSVQYGDTIYPPVFKTYPAPMIKPASSPIYKDNANRNIQIIGKNEGIIAAMVWSITEDRRGNIWMGTFGGAICYDGASLRTFTVNEGLNNNWVSSIYEDKHGRIWFSHQMSNSGVTCFDGHQFCSFTTAQGICGNQVNSVIEDKNGNIWFGTDRGLTCFTGKSFINYTERQGLCNNMVLDLLEDKGGFLWIATLGGISIYDGKKFVELNVKKGFFKANSIIEDKKGNFWFTSNMQGLIKFDGRYFTYYTDEQGLTSNHVIFNNLIEDRDGNIWVGTDKGINCFDGKSFTQITADNGLSNNQITCLYEDSGGNIWIGTRGNGANCFKKNSFIHYTEKDGLPLSTVRAIYEDKSGNIWIGTWGGGVSKFDGISFTNYDLESEIKGTARNDVRAIIEDEKGQLWFGTGNGLDCFDGENLIHYTTKQGLPDDGIGHLYKDLNGNIWIGTWEGGLSCWDGKSFTNYYPIEEIGFDGVNPMCEDKEGNLWITGSKGICCYNNKESIIKLIRQPLAKEGANCLVETGDGYILAGSLGFGLTCLDQKNYFNFTSKNGLSDDNVITMSLDKKKDIWVGNGNGLNYLKSKLFSGTILGNWNSCEDCSGMTYSFGVLDGLKSSGIYQHALFIDSKDRLWIGTNDALSLLNLRNFAIPETVPKIQLNAIEIQGLSIDFRKLQQPETLAEIPDPMYREILNHARFDSIAAFYSYPIGLKLPHKLNHLTFFFSGIDWIAPHKLVYQYMLEGLEKQWSNTVSKNLVDYRNIPYGNYIFKVRVRGASGKWSSTYEYPFTIYSPWWHTWWARTIYGLLAVFLIAVYTRWRTHKIERERKILEIKVKDRTAEVVAQKMEIESKNEELQHQKEEIETINEELQQQNEEISAQRDQLALTNQSINESIQYAQRIQSAVLPNFAYIDEILPENFILFRPRDKVCGDFYWVKQIDRQIIIAVADCTGHGVPGALMSMLGISYLSEIIQKREIIQPAQALNELRKQIKKSLHQTGKLGEAEDGIDMALCAFDTKSMVLQYAGAMNPLYLIKNGELEEIMADRMPVGFYPNEKTGFTNHEIQLKTNDLFYLFSDGITDQFGGEKGMKFKASNFKKILLENHDKPMQIQKEKLEQTLQNWMKTYEQTDDILVMGVRV
ncbi:MAG: two-component regulator propeller domain-containing protein [Bacteroidales bacterium]